MMDSSIIGLGKIGTLIQELKKRWSLSDRIIWITTPDAVIAETAATLAEQQSWEGYSVVHCSGALPSTVLQPLREQGARIASCHPMLSVVNAEQALERFPGTLWTLEGDPTLLAELETWLQGLGAVTARISVEQKPLYHAACCVAANYLVTLSALAQDCFQQAGLDPEVLNRGLLHLQQSVLLNLSQQSQFMEALTGPVARGDWDTVQGHCQVLKPLGHEKIYSDLADLTRRLYEEV